ncbi:kinase-like domain-containing protein [Mycena galopus ATCC 62051]|nr:kinase-like domain-containing protein [Mycena galopus ATCC 62051]
MENGSGSTHTTSRGIYQHMNLCLSVAVVGLVLVLQNRDSYHEFLTYRGTDAQRLLDSLQDCLDLDSISVVKPLICKALLRLSNASGLYPRCFTLTGLKKVGQQVDGGGFGDIWKGLVNEHSVCVKIMRIFQNDRVEDLLKEFSREALIWRQLCHPNLLSFFGLYYLDNRLCLVSPWMENGNVVEFLRKHSSDVDCLSLILDVALGLEYLHKQKVVHGDLKGINILITPSRRACIADFGLSSIINAMTVQLTTSSAPTRGGTARYQAPELFEGGSPNSFASDVYGFACVCYEILTGKVPFYELPNDMAVMFSVARGEHPPELPPIWTGLRTSMLDGLWELLQNCWDGQAENRPTAPQIVQRLVRSPISATTTSCKTDWDHKFTSKFRRALQAQPCLPSTLMEEEPEARKESFPDHGSSAPQNTEDSPEHGRQSKRPYQEKMAGPSSDDDSGTGRPTAKRWKPSPEIIDLTLED